MGHKHSGGVHIPWQYPGEEPDEVFVGRVRYVREMRWQPIETAPKDETWVLLYGEYMGEPRVQSGFWGVGDGWFDSEAASHSLTAFEWAPEWAPTHWMPFSEPLKL